MKRLYRIRFARETDINAWMDLVTLVRNNFPGLETFPRDVAISVTTFRENDEKGIAPRSLYKKFGFVESEFVEKNGYLQQEFILHRK
jgi:hypothetical protein